MLPVYLPGSIFYKASCLQIVYNTESIGKIMGILSMKMFCTKI